MGRGFLCGRGRAFPCGEACETVFGQVLADHAEQLLGGVADFIEVAGGDGDAFVRELLGDELAVAEDVVDGRAQVVAELRQRRLAAPRGTLGGGAHAAGADLPTRVSWAAIFSSRRGSSMGFVS